MYSVVQVNLRAPRMVQQDEFEVVVDVGALMRHKAETVALFHHLLRVAAFQRVCRHRQVVHQPAELYRKIHCSHALLFVVQQYR